MTRGLVPPQRPVWNGKAFQRAWRGEREWRQIFITGATPEHAVEQVRVHYYNTRPAFERMRARSEELPFKVVRQQSA